MAYDLLIRNALLLDGSGRAPVLADVAVAGERIAAVGRIEGGARETLDADGLALAPGIVDLHTHYDAQVTWDGTCSPSPSLGVTTAVIGNCGFGIAPCPPSLRETVVKNLSVVEGMDLDALLTGVRWEFESFAQYMDQLRRIGPCLNLGVFARSLGDPHRGDGRRRVRSRHAGHRRARARCGAWCARRWTPARSVSPRRSRPITAASAARRCPRRSRATTNSPRWSACSARSAAACS